MKIKLTSALIIVTVVLLLSAGSVLAADGPITGDVAIDDTLAAAGLGVVVMAITEIIKRLGWIPDGAAGKVAAIMGTVAYLVVLVLGWFNINILDAQGQVVVAVLQQISTLAVTIVTALGVYGVLRKGEIIQPLPGREPSEP